MTTDFHAEVEKVRTWLTTNRWVDQYDYWWSEGGVVSALQHFLARVQPRDWSEDDVTDLLYLLEQSSTNYIAELVTQSELMTLAIAKHSLARGGIAGDDIAEQLGHCIERRDEAEALLIEFMRDEHERTRRLALLSLAAIQSAAVPALAVAAWDTGEEYPRMGALSALKTIGSKLFPIYLSLAQEDGREHLVSLARKYADELAIEIPFPTTRNYSAPNPET
ncbi:HEAT repeat domain-containing protein [Massilia sp. PAMC28688]|uniref:HEAT repeat domain-containing protein n=1 Tax=Massilia sp. PAMC28688 TaxID=2861283 RepID=UPI001C629E8C|nr:HEAT repeat domain-containing protein [Massilia sp. PAMC28688]QYF95285.1 HEAT repeat domain-containing protein [Massilia sp. PAMC28688]